MPCAGSSLTRCMRWLRHCHADAVPARDFVVMFSDTRSHLSGTRATCILQLRVLSQPGSLSSSSAPESATQHGR